MSIILVATICVVAAYLWRKLFPIIRKQLRQYELGEKFVGPSTVPILGNCAQIPIKNYEVSSFFDSLTHKYVKEGANAVRLWFAHILYVFPLDGKTVEAILDSQEEIVKASDYDIMHPWLGDGLLLSNGEKWKNRRRMLTPTFHYSMLDSFVETMDRNAKILTDILSQQVGTGKLYDIYPIVKRCALDIICETAMGFQLNSMLDDDNKYALAVGRMGTMTVEHAYRPWLWNYYMRKIIGFQDEFESVLKTLKDFSDGVIQDRIRCREAHENYSETNRKAFLDMMLDMRDSDNLTDEDIREQVDTFMVAGHDSTSTAVSWTIWALATHPEIQERVAKEVFDVLGNATSVTVKEITELHYLDIVLKESLRINPPVSIVGRNLKSDFQIDGKTVPAGANLYIAPLMIHRNERLYPNPTRFDPDRFLPENSKNRHAYDFIPFSAGPRNCIGQKFAMYEAKVLLASMIRQFKFSTDQAFLDKVGCLEFVYRPHLGVPVVIEKRD